MNSSPRVRVRQQRRRSTRRCSSAIARANVGHAFGYGHDDYTQQVEARFAEQFGADARAFFVFNGTGGNVLSPARDVPAVGGA